MLNEAFLQLFHLFFNGFFSVTLHAGIDGGIDPQAIGVHIHIVCLGPGLQRPPDSCTDVGTHGSMFIGTVGFKVLWYFYILLIIITIIIVVLNKDQKRVV